MSIDAEQCSVVECNKCILMSYSQGITIESLLEILIRLVETLHRLIISTHLELADTYIAQLQTYIHGQTYSRFLHLLESRNRDAQSTLVVVSSLQRVG